MHTAIFNEVHQKRFHLAEQAPICNAGLKGDFRYLADTKSARKVLDGTYSFSDDCHPATKELLEEIARIQKIVPKDSVPNLITREVWQQ